MWLNRCLTWQEMQYAIDERVYRLSIVSVIIGTSNWEDRVGFCSAQNTLTITLWSPPAHIAALRI